MRFRRPPSGWDTLSPDMREIVDRVCTPKEKEAIKLRESGWSMRKISWQLGISVSAVRARLENGTRKILHEAPEWRAVVTEQFRPKEVEAQQQGGALRSWLERTELEAQQARIVAAALVEEIERNPKLQRSAEDQIRRIVESQRVFRVPLSKRVRAAVVERDGPACHMCAKDCIEEEIQIDHLFPRFWGGDDSMGNLAVSCATCNQRRGAGPIPPSSRYASVFDRLRLREVARSIRRAA